MQKVVGFFSKPENLFVLTLLIGLFTGTYKVVSKASNHNNSLYQRVSSPICFYLRLFGYVYTLPWIGSLLISGGNYEEWLQASKNTEPYRFFIIGLVMIFGSYAMYIPVLLERIARGIMNKVSIKNDLELINSKFGTSYTASDYMYGKGHIKQIVTYISIGEESIAELISNPKLSDAKRTVILDLLSRGLTVQGFITNLFANTEDKTKHGGDAFWDKTAKMMLSALMYYVWYECPETEMNFGTVMELILAETVEEGDEAGISATQVLIEELRARSPRHIAVRYFDAYRKGAGETIMSIQESLLSRLEKFLLEDVVNLTTGDELELEKIGEEKTALFIRMPDDNSFHFLASALITQLFQLMMAQADARSTGSLPVPVHFVLEEARNITLPDSFQNWVATMRSRNITLSIILQNISQIKRMFPDDWESVSGMCDEILYLGGNEQSTHEWISKAMGQETIDNRSYGTTHSWTSGSNSTNEQNSGRALMDVTEVRLKNKLLKGKIGSVIMILADERPIIDEKYDLNRHPRIKLSADGGAPQYSYVSSALLPETNTIQINETDVDEDEVDGVFTFDLQNVELN